MVFKWPPDWRDPDAMAYYLSDFSSQAVRPARKLAFWSRLTCEVCLYRRTIVITVADIQKLLTWRGIEPRCLGGVFEEMEKCRQIVKIERLTESWRDWGLNIISSPLTNVLKRIWRSEERDQRYVVLSVLEACCKQVVEQAQTNPDNLYSLTQWEALVKGCVSPGSVDTVTNYLAYKRQIAVYGTPTTLVKVLLAGENTVSEINQVDIAIGTANSTIQTLSTKISTMNTKVEEQYRCAKSAASRPAALNHLRRKKMYEKTVAQWEGALNNTESVLLQLQSAQHNKTILSTLRVGSDALESSKISLTEVDELMGRLEEYKGYEEDLTAAMTLESNSNEGDETLEEELAALLKAQLDEADDVEVVSTKRVDVIDLTLPDVPSHAPGTPPNTNKVHAPATPPNINMLDLDNEEPGITSGSVPSEIKARLSPELRRKPGRKLVGVMAPET